MLNRSKLLNKVRALLAKTTANGCTEAEAMSALGKAREMMDAYEITEADLQLTGETASILNASPGDTHQIKSQLAVAVARFCDCKAWSATDGIRFCGLRSDVDFAVWLHDYLAAFVRRELTAFLARNPGPPGTRRRLITGFVLGASNRISTRLVELARPAATPNGRALVVAKNALITEAMAGLNLRQPRHRGRRVRLDAYEAGKSAGDRANFGRPVSGAAATLRLS